MPEQIVVNLKVLVPEVFEPALTRHRRSGGQELAAGAGGVRQQDKQETGVPTAVFTYWP